MSNQPMPKSGYALWSVGRRAKQAWRSISDESWAHVMVSPSEGDFELLGRRQIDGALYLVWWRHSKQDYIAQTAVSAGLGRGFY
jgi:hypothetical protein